MNYCYNFIKYTQKITYNYKNNNIKYVKLRCYKCNSLKPTEGWYYVNNNNNSIKYYCSNICVNN